MEDLQSSHKELTCTVLKHFQTMFAYVLHQNKNNPEKIRWQPTECCQSCF